MKRTIYLFLLFALVGCATGSVALVDLNLNLGRIKAAVERAMPKGVRFVSENGREYRSNYFLKIGKRLQNAKTFSRREFARVLVLGDKRPYKVKIDIIREKRTSSKGSVVPTYARTGLNKPMAAVMGRKIMKILSKRRNGANSVDAFEPFK